MSVSSLVHRSILPIYSPSLRVHTDGRFSAYVIMYGDLIPLWWQTYFQDKTALNVTLFRVGWMMEISVILFRFVSYSLNFLIYSQF